MLKQCMSICPSTMPLGSARAMPFPIPMAFFIDVDDSLQVLLTCPSHHRFFAKEVR